MDHYNCHCLSRGVLFIWFINEPSHDIMVLYVLCKLILQTRMRGHPLGLDV